jgi:hypothetical protein
MADKTDPCIEILDSRSYEIPPQQEDLDRNLQKWLSWPPAAPDISSAILYHVLCSAHRQRKRIICRLRDIRTCVTLAGLQKVAESFSVQVHCNWRWPDTPGFKPPAFREEPRVLESQDWILEELDGKLRLSQAERSSALDILPEKNPVLNPEFNPVLLKRLLRACLRMQDEGVRRIAIYGAGRHTDELLRWGLPDEFELVALVTSTGTCDKEWRLPVVSLGAVADLGVDALMLSSSSFEPEMRAQAEKAGIAHVITLYSDWPARSFQGRNNPLLEKSMI